MENKQVIEQWNKVAEKYSHKQRVSLNNKTNKHIILDMLGQVKGKKILDAGCGDGHFANMLKDLGAEICAFDGSQELVKIAKSDFPNVDFSVCDITQKLPYQNKQFDIVICSLVLMDVPNVDVFFKECHRMLKDDGTLVFTVMHPCFFPADWQEDEQGNRLYKKIYSYWQQTKITLDLWGETTHYHRTISWYSQQLKESGFAITQIKENPDNINNCGKVHQRRVPLFCCFECKKFDENKKV